MWLGTANTPSGAVKTPILLSFLLLGVVRAALNLDGSHAIKPATRPQDPSPIDDIDAYYPDQHDCPLPCADVANVHSWITYFSTDRLRRCSEPMLLQFSLSHPLAKSANETTTNVIRACTLASLRTSAAGAVESESPAGEPYAHKMKNPKLSETLVDVGVDTAAACAAKGIRVSDEKPKLAKTGGNAPDAHSRQLAGLVEGMGLYFADEDNCDESAVFAYHDGVVSGAYIGAGLGKPTIASALEALIDDMASGADGSRVATRTVVEVCGKQRQSPARILGIVLDTKGDLNGIRKTALGWRQGKCSVDSATGQLAGADIFNIAGAPLDVNGTKIASASSEDTAFHSRFRDDRKRFRNRGLKGRAGTCDYQQIQVGDGCPSLVVKCGITAQELVRFNPQPGLCGSLKENDYVCCSAGEPYASVKAADDVNPPPPQSDGTCQTHIIKDGDTCDSLARQHGITVEDIEKWNQGKTWGWDKCGNMLREYNMCLSPGTPPLPPPQEGTACGPMVPGTSPPTDGTPLADLNPCPLKACCSNWGFCGVFPAHCDIRAPEGAGPGVKNPDASSSCVSNCGVKIKQNSGPPASFGRIGYYESWSMGRDCLKMRAESADVDGSYTHMHWGFIVIDPQTWKPVIKDPHGQWKGFKALPQMKRVISIGGWADSTEQPMAGILRRAIIDNRDLFATNLAQFAKDEGLDGIDIDWEYPGAPDIYDSDGKLLGEKSDGLNYLKFLMTLKQKVAAGVSVSIAAPASFWYLKAFPIDRIAAVIDYIVYMTYDLHGQWDYGNPNAFDECDSGKCIRSHVNITETRNALGMITKAGVPNNKIFVGESSYGRSFHMAQNGCWGPLCEFTGSRLDSDAKPGRCTGQGGYLANAEINEIIKRGQATRVFRDETSDSDIILYEGDYVSYMTATTKEKRRGEWQGLNFAGSIDWAVDLQFFGEADVSDSINPPVDENGNSCVSGEDNTINTGDLCEFTCSLGFCPEPLCSCESYGDLVVPPVDTDGSDYIGYDEHDVELNRLCAFGCMHGYCPEKQCYKIPPPPDDGNVMLNRNNSSKRDPNKFNCVIFKDKKNSKGWEDRCYTPCRSIVKEAQEEGRITNYGCGGFWPGAKEVPWEYIPGLGEVAKGECTCDSWLINELAETIIEALPIIAQIGCFILMSAFKLVLDIALEAFGVGRIISAGLDMAATAAQIVNFVYNPDEDPFGAFEWWLSPCGDTSLVPDEIRRVFDILSTVSPSRTSYKEPKKVGKGTGKKGDQGNPQDRSKPRANNNNAKQTPKCNIPARFSTIRVGVGQNTVREQSCVSDSTHRSEWVVTTVTYANNAPPLAVTASCKPTMGQACYHYSSAIREHPQWATLTCPPEAGTTGRNRDETRVKESWTNQRSGDGWLDRGLTSACDRDEYPPVYLLNQNDPAYINAGLNVQGQSLRFLPNKENRSGGSLWKGACFSPVTQKMTNAEIKAGRTQPGSRPSVNLNPGKGKKNQHIIIKTTTTEVSAFVNARPEFSITGWFQSRNPLPNDGLDANTKCWPRARAAADPGFTLLTFDGFYNGQPPPYDYSAAYVAGQNGS